MIKNPCNIVSVVLACCLIHGLLLTSIETGSTRMAPPVLLVHRQRRNRPHWSARQYENTLWYFRSMAVPTIDTGHYHQPLAIWTDVSPRVDKKPTRITVKVGVTGITVNLSMTESVDHNMIIFLAVLPNMNVNLYCAQLLWPDTPLQ